MPDTVQAPLFFKGSLDEHVRKVALVVNEALLGKTNNTIRELTLAANATETVIENDRYCYSTVVTLMPKTASAAAALAAGAVYITATNGSITIHHDASPDEDRTFGAVLVG
jgi:hypothetical protein